MGKERLLNADLIKNVREILLENDADTGVTLVMEALGKACDLTRVFLLRTNEIPYMLRMTNIWEAEELLSGKEMHLDYSENRRTGFRNDDECVFCMGNVEAAEANMYNLDLAFRSNAKALLTLEIACGSDFVGSLVLVDSASPRNWHEEEIKLYKEIGRILFPAVQQLVRSDILAFLSRDARRALQDNIKVKKKFLSNMSHDIKTPLNAVNGMITIMRSNIDNPEVLSQCFDRIERSIKQINSLINDCLDMSMNSEDTSLVDNTWFMLGELLEEISREVAPLAEAKGQHYSVKTEKNVFVFGDRVKLTRILLNTLSNAMKFTPENGEIQLSVVRGGRQNNRRLFSFRIKDNGIGIKEGFLKNVFEPFVKEKDKGVENNGAGLGMAITKHFVDLMHGTIDVYSTDGKGTEVVIELPLEEGKTEVKEVIADEEVPAFTEMYIGRRILVADDNSLTAEVLAEMLGSRGLEAERAVDGKEAYEMYMAKEPFYYDMILLDGQMPVMDGIEAARAIRQSGRADAVIIPIVGLSANAQDGDVGAAFGEEVNICLKKPVNEQVLFEAIGNLVI